MKIQSLKDTRFDTLAGAFQSAFGSYEVQISHDELRRMLRRRGFDAALSFAAFDDEGHIAAFTLNGIGTFGGRRTAYDTGTGTLPDYRGQGLATRIFEASLPRLRAAGIEQYLLEVLQHNDAAVSVYRRLGFEVSREFDYFRAENDRVRADSGEHAVRRIAVESPDAGDVAGFQDFAPSWQNDFEAVGRAADDFVALGVYDGERLVGYSIFEPAAGDIAQIAVARSHRRRGIGSSLLRSMVALNRAPGVKCLNTESSCESIARFMEASGIALAGRQFEMVRDTR